MVHDAWLVGLGGVAGALLRHGITAAIGAEDFPFGTLTVNVVGSFLLGFATFLAPGRAVLLFVGTGMAGALTTFSSFSFDTVRLWETDERRSAVIYAVVNFLGAAIAIGLGWLLARVLV